MSHSSEPEAWPHLLSSWIETNAIVLHGKLNSATNRAKLDLDRAGVCMAGDVAKRLLRDPVKTRDRARVSSSTSLLALNLVGIPSTAPKRAHSAFSASINPRSSRIAGCSA